MNIKTFKLLKFQYDMCGMYKKNFALTLAFNHKKGGFLIITNIVFGVDY